MKTHLMNVRREIENLFFNNGDKMNEREDSRAFGAMIEKRILDNWTEITDKTGGNSPRIPGRRTIYDFAHTYGGNLYGFDVKTKDLDSNKYSDGGVCAVGNLLKFLANDKGIFVIIEISHRKSSENKTTREISHINVVPFHSMPENMYRIENLGTGQVRFEKNIDEIINDIDWYRSIVDFYDFFTILSIKHYEKVIYITDLRKSDIERFRKNNYENFSIQ